MIGTRTLAKKKTNVGLYKSRGLRMAASEIKAA